jgi:hypothetical protein
VIPPDKKTPGVLARRVSTEYISKKYPESRKIPGEKALSMCFASMTSCKMSYEYFVKSKKRSFTKKVRSLSSHQWPVSKLKQAEACC